MSLTISLSIIILTALVSFSAFSNEKLMNDLIFYPPAVSRRNQWYRFITCGLIHADAAHLIFNMLSFYFFGDFVESQFVDIFGAKGKALYLLMYVSSLVVCLLPTYWKNKDNTQYRSLGASGAVSAVIFAGILFNPAAQLGLLIIPGLKIPGFIFGPAYLLLTAWLDKRGGGNINHSAHLWGALYGMAFVIVVGKFLGDYNALSEAAEIIKQYLNR